MIMIDGVCTDKPILCQSGSFDMKNVNMNIRHSNE